jgi:hypothetical protein
MYKYWGMRGDFVVKRNSLAEAGKYSVSLAICAEECYNIGE